MGEALKLREVLTEMVIMAIVVGALSFFAGGFLVASFATDGYADVMDEFAEWYYDLGAPDEAREARDTATQIRDEARDFQNYGLYCLVGALLVLVCDTSLWAWRWRKK